MSEPIIWIPVISLWQPWANGVVTPHPEMPERPIKEFETRFQPYRENINLILEIKYNFDLCN